MTDILWKTDEKKEYAWLRLGDDVYDFMKTESGFETTVRTKDYATYKGKALEIILLQIMDS